MIESIKLINNKNYPYWISSHPSFKKFPVIRKIFPMIGLDNFKIELEEKIQLNNDSSAKILINLFYSIITSKYPTYYYIRSTTSISLTPLMGAFEVVHENNGLISIKLFKDVILSDGNKFKAGMKFFKVLAAIEKYGFKSAQFNNTNEVKIFNQSNVSTLNAKVCFSSSGEDGIWDVATMSMRGIKSCQTWTNKPKSHNRRIVGSILDPFTGIIYLQSGSNDPTPYGSKMLFRCIVRYVFNIENNESSLFLERMYPFENANIRNIFVNVLNNKLKSYNVNLNIIKNDYIDNNHTYIPPSLESKFLLEHYSNSLSYRDSAVRFIDGEDNILDENTKSLISCFAIENQLYHINNSSYDKLKQTKLLFIEKYKKIFNSNKFSKKNLSDKIENIHTLSFANLRSQKSIKLKDRCNAVTKFDKHQRLFHKYGSIDNLANSIVENYIVRVEAAPHLSTAILSKTLSASIKKCIGFSKNNKKLCAFIYDQSVDQILKLSKKPLKNLLK